MLDKIANILVSEFYPKLSGREKFRKEIDLKEVFNSSFIDVPAVYLETNFNLTHPDNLDERLWILFLYFGYLGSVNYRKYNCTLVVNDKKHTVETKKNLEHLIKYFLKTVPLETVNSFGYVLTPKREKLSYEAVVSIIMLTENLKRSSRSILVDYVKKQGKSAKNPINNLGFQNLMTKVLGDAYLKSFHILGTDQSYVLPLFESIYKCLWQALGAYNTHKFQPKIPYTVYFKVGEGDVLFSKKLANKSDTPAKNFLPIFVDTFKDLSVFGSNLTVDSQIKGEFDWK